MRTRARCGLEWNEMNKNDDYVKRETKVRNRKFIYNVACEMCAKGEYEGTTGASTHDREIDSRRREAAVSLLREPIGGRRGEEEQEMRRSVSLRRERVWWSGARRQREHHRTASSSAACQCERVGSHATASSFTLDTPVPSQDQMREAGVRLNEISSPRIGMVSLTRVCFVVLLYGKSRLSARVNPRVHARVALYPLIGI